MKGACVRTSLGWEIGESLTIMRLDTKGIASARVARVDRSGEAVHTIGIEIIDANDIWQLNKKRIERKAATGSESRHAKQLV